MRIRTLTLRRHRALAADDSVPAGHAQSAEGISRWPRRISLATGGFARPVIEDTVARGHLRLDSARYTGKVNGNDVDAFPFPITMADMRRGQERFNIFCSPCHGRLGNGQGMIVKRGFRQPPSYHTDKLKNAPVGHFFDVATNGFGAMPSYASRVPVDDRWRIIAYIRALQFSDSATVSDVPPADRPLLDRAPATTPAGAAPGSVPEGRAPAAGNPERPSEAGRGTAEMTIPDNMLGPRMDRIQRLSLIIGIVFLALTAVGLFVDPGQFFRSYLYAYMYCLGLSVGCLGILLLHNTVGGTWGVVIRRLLESGTRTFPLMALLLVPVLFGMTSLYIWARPEIAEHDKVIQWKAGLPQRSVLHRPNGDLLLHLDVLLLDSEP